MSTRERWIVYPLLFLALGTAIKPKLAPPAVTPPEPRRLDSAIGSVSADRVVCRELQVVGRDGRPRVHLTASAGSGGGEIHVRDNNNQVVIVIQADAASRAGLVETRNEHGRAQTMMMSSAAGGELVAYDDLLRRSVRIGHRGGRMGLVETDLQTGESRLVPLPGVSTE